MVCYMELNFPLSDYCKEFWDVIWDLAPSVAIRWLIEYARE